MYIYLKSQLANKPDGSKMDSNYLFSTLLLQRCLEVVEVGKYIKYNLHSHESQLIG